MLLTDKHNPYAHFNYVSTNKVTFRLSVAMALADCACNLYFFTAGSGEIVFVEIVIIIIIHIIGTRPHASLQIRITKSEEVRGPRPAVRV